jgi:butyrate kinase
MKTTDVTDEALAAFLARGGVIKRVPPGAIGTWEEIKAAKNQERKKRAGEISRRIAVAVANDAKRERSVASLSELEKAAAGSTPPWEGCR